MFRFRSPHRDNQGSASTRRLLVAFSSVLGVGLALAAQSGCDNQATITPYTNYFQAIEVVSAVPAKINADGDAEAVCGAWPAGADERPDGVILSLVYKSYQRTDKDPDLSLRPGDKLDFRKIAASAEEAATTSGTIDLWNANLISPGSDGTCLDRLVCTENTLDGTTPCGDTNGVATTQCTHDSTLLPSVVKSHYVEDSASRDDGHNIIFVVDNSSSTLGLVHPDTFKEVSPSESFIPPALDEVASDYNKVRHTSIQRVINDLSDDDRIGIIAFGEGFGGTDSLVVPCSAEGVGGNVVTDLETCFGTNRDLWLSSGAGDNRSLKTLEGAKGRANLWSGVYRAYEFLSKSRANLAEASVEYLRDTRRSRHIVVLTDGPDTCSPAESHAYGDCQNAGCNSTRTLSEVKALIAKHDDPAQRADQNPNPIRIHFVQFESKGYQGRDPQQIEVSCLTGGHYQFINSEDIARITESQIGNFNEDIGCPQTDDLNAWQECPGGDADCPMVNGQQVYNCINTTQAGDPKCQLRCDDAEQAAAAALTEALDVALSNVRLSLMGQWHLNQKLSALSVDDTLNDGGLPPGALYALSGSIQYEEELGLKQTLIAGAGQSTAIGEQGVGTKLTEIYDVGRDVTSATMWDRRPTIRKPCAAPVDCAIMSDGANPPTETECFIVCDTGTSLCPNSGDGAPAREGLSVGVSGQCCDGTCYANAANKECQACIDWNIGVSSSDNPYGSNDTQCGG